MSTTRYRASSPRALLKFALTRIKAGWTRGTNFRRVKGRDQYCLEGSMVHGKPYRSVHIRHAAFDALEAAVCQQHWPLRSIVGFNDQPGRTKSEVVAVLKTAIAKAPTRV